MTVTHYFARCLAVAAVIVFAAPVTNAADDPYIGLEDIEAESSLEWARKQNARSLAILEREPEFGAMQREALEILTSEARIPYGFVLGEHFFNFWQDAEHVRGILRRATLASYITGQPEWETVLDIDELAAREKENWVYQNVDCLAPEYERCLVGVSRGGTDATVYREYSIADRRFVADGFLIPEAKSSADWIDSDRLLVGTDWGNDSRTESGYARTVKIVHRGKPISSASEVFTATVEDVAAWAQVHRDESDVYPFVRRALTFFKSEFYLIAPDGGTRKLPLPPRAELHGVIDGRAIAELNEK